MDVVNERLSHLWRGVVPRVHVYSFRLLSSNGPPVVFRDVRMELGPFPGYGAGVSLSTPLRRRALQRLRQGLVYDGIDLAGGGVSVFGLDPSDAGEHGYVYALSLAHPLRNLAPGLGMDFVMGTYPQVGCFLGFSWESLGLYSGAGVSGFASSDFATVANSDGLMWMVPMTSSYYRKPPGSGVSSDADDAGSSDPDYLYRYLSPASDCYIKSRIGYRFYYMLPLGVVDSQRYISDVRQACSERMAADGVSGVEGLPLFAPEILSCAALMVYEECASVLRAAGAIPVIVSPGAYAAAASSHLQGVSMRFHVSDASRFSVCDFVQTTPDVFSRGYYGTVPRYQRAYVHERLPLRDGFYNYFYYYHVGRVVVLSVEDLAYYVSRAASSHPVNYFKVPVLMERKRDIDIPYLMASVRYLLSFHGHVCRLSRLAYMYRVVLESLGRR